MRVALWLCSGLTALGFGQKSVERGPTVTHTKCMLQQQDHRWDLGSGLIVGHAPAAANRVPKTHKVAWLHIPKCGQTFAYTIVHHANRSLPAGTEMNASRGLKVLDFAERLGDQLDFEHLIWRNTSFGSHLPITEEAWSQWRGKFMAMFRSPAIRMFSEHDHVRDDGFNPFTGMYKPAYQNITDYFIRNRGTTAQMLSGQREGFEENYVNLDGTIHIDLELAKSRLKGFAFVGLTEEWDLSICLFHAMFGGPCRQPEFANMHPGNYTQTNPSNPFEKFEDIEDAAIFEEVNKTFWKNMMKYKVNRRSCQEKFCKHYPDPFVVKHVSGNPSLLSVQDWDYNWPGRLQVDESML